MQQNKASLPTLPPLPYYSQEQQETMNVALHNLFITVALEKDLPKCWQHVTGLITLVNLPIAAMRLFGLDAKPFEEARNIFISLRMMIEIRMKTHLLN